MNRSRQMVVTRPGLTGRPNVIAACVGQDDALDCASPPPGLVWLTVAASLAYRLGYCAAWRPSSSRSADGRRALLAA